MTQINKIMNKNKMETINKIMNILNQYETYIKNKGLWLDFIKNHKHRV